MYFINVGEKFGQNPRHVLEDALDAFYQLGHNGLLLAIYVATFTSIAIYYYVGMSITKEANATTRVILDSSRILIIWGIAIGAGIILLSIFYGNCSLNFLTFQNCIFCLIPKSYLPLLCCNFECLLF